MGYSLKFNKLKGKACDSDIPEDNVSVMSEFQHQYYKDLADRIIWIDTEINDYTVLAIKQILRWNMEDKGIPAKKRKPIYIFFFSYGGDANVCTAFIDAVTSSITPIIGVNAGVAYSAAAYMFIACPVRFMMKKASILFHQGSAEFSGNFSIIMAEIEEYKKKVERLSSIIQEFTEIPEEEITEKIEDEWYVYADEALEKGVCDRIVNSAEEVFTVNYKKLKKR